MVHVVSQASSSRPNRPTSHRQFCLTSRMFFDLVHVHTACLTLVTGCTHRASYTINRLPIPGPQPPPPVLIATSRKPYSRQPDLSSPPTAMVRRLPMTYAMLCDRQNNQNPSGSFVRDVHMEVAYGWEYSDLGEPDTDEEEAGDRKSVV